LGYVLDGRTNEIEAIFFQKLQGLVKRVNAATALLTCHLALYVSRLTSSIRLKAGWITTAFGTGGGGSELTVGDIGIGGKDLGFFPSISSFLSFNTFL